MHRAPLAGRPFFSSVLACWRVLADFVRRRPGFAVYDSFIEIVLASCSGDRGLNELHNREIDLAIAHPKVLEVGPGGSLVHVRSALGAGFRDFGHQKREKWAIWGAEIHTDCKLGYLLKESVRPHPLEVGVPTYRPPGRESRGCCAILFVPRCPWAERVLRDPKLRTSSSWGCSVVGRSTTLPSLGWAGAIS